MEHEGDGDTNHCRYTWNDRQMFSKMAGRVEKRRLLETIQTTALLRSARIPRRVLEI